MICCWYDTFLTFLIFPLCGHPLGLKHWEAHVLVVERGRTGLACWGGHLQVGHGSCRDQRKRNCREKGCGPHPLEAFVARGRVIPKSSIQWSFKTTRYIKETFPFSLLFDHLLKETIPQVGTCKMTICRFVWLSTLSVQTLQGCKRRRTGTCWGSGFPILEAGWQIAPATYAAVTW